MLVSLVTFAAFNVIPGDPAAIILGTNASPEKVAALRQQLGLDQNLLIRYIHWMENLVRGDLGQSIRFSTPVKDLLVTRIPVTLWLAIFSLLLIAIISIPLGIYSAKKEGGAADAAINVTGQINMAIPSFFLGMLLILIFGIVLKLFAPGDYVDYKQDFGGFLKYLLIPAIAIALPKIAMVVKFLRSEVIRQMSLDYVRTAYSKGNKDNAVLYRHVLKNALIPVITLMGMIVADILANSIIIEQLFALPGIGRLLIVGISARDFPLVQAIVIYMAAIVVIINFLVDLFYRVIDPRIRLT
jgi:ABC-type dipeptide/oligopeptide/nickel transport systems, permease components